MRKNIFIKCDNMYSPVLRLHKDYNMSKLNAPNDYYLGRKYICEGVFAEGFYAMTHHLPKYVCKEVIVDEEFEKKFDFTPYRFDITKIDDIAIAILKTQPRLQMSTCMGWEPYDDKTKNPNIMNGTYVFPDGNYYSLILRCGTVYIYPGKADIHFIYKDSGKIPLSVFKIDKQKWAYHKEIVKL